MKESKALKAALRQIKKKNPDVRLVLASLQRASNEGDASAAYALATWYLHGTHVKQNRAKAVTLLKEAAKENIPEALFDLAICYEKGAGAKKSDKKACELYFQAAIWGDKQSHYEVGRCLFYGIGIKRNRRLANIWLDRAKSLGLS